MKKSLDRPSSLLGGPVLQRASFDFSSSVDVVYPFSLPLIKNLDTIEFPTQVTFLVGENGTGKSTILEAIAAKIGFGPEGGSKNMSFKTADEKNYTGSVLLAEYITLSWTMKPANGYFFRAESFFSVANHIDQMEHEGCGNGYASYGGKSLHAQSHGESFMAFFSNRLGNDGLFLFDEPESALSLQRQLGLLSIINEMCKNPKSQFIIATHSPFLLAYPTATIYSCDTDFLTPIAYTSTDQYRLTKNFLDNPDLYLHHLFNS